MSTPKKLASSREFWSKINQAKNQKKRVNLPNLMFQNNVYKIDDEKANIFCVNLSELFTDNLYYFRI